MSVTVVVDLALFGIGELEAGPYGVYAQTFAFNKTEAIPYVYYFCQREVST